MRRSLQCGPWLARSLLMFCYMIVEELQPKIAVSVHRRGAAQSLTRTLIGYATTLVVVVVVDAVWLGVIAKQMYRDGIGHLMADKPNWIAVGLFYPLFAISLMVFAVIPHLANARSRKTVVAAALFGFFAYATYDLTNLGTLRGWPWQLSLIDTLWGTAISAIAAFAGRTAMKHFHNLN